MQGPLSLPFNNRETLYVEEGTVMIRLLHTLSLTLLLTGSLACELFPFAPRPSRRFTPPADWRATYDSVARCAGLSFRANYDRVNWYVVEGFSFETRDGEALGYWHGDNIFLAEHTVYPERAIEGWDHYGPAEQQLIREFGREVVRHESLHHVRQRDGHPAPPFCTCARLAPSCP